MRTGTSRGRIVIACLGACIGLGAAAQGPSAAWRCGNTYSDRPCEGGRAVAAVDAPSAERMREADSSTRQLQAEAQRMERERLRIEKAQARRSGLVHLPRPTNAVTPPEPAPSKAHKKKGRKEPDFFTAAGPGSGTTKKKAKAAKAEIGS